MSEQEYGTELLVLSVGKTPAPLIKSIDDWRPKYVVFVPSGDTREKIIEIENKIKWKGIEDKMTLQISDADDPNVCLVEIRKGLRKFMDMKKLPHETKVTADYTGGTKSMVCAMALVMNDFNSEFSYVTGDRNPLDGRVIPGTEHVLSLINPWSDMGIQPIRRLVYAFNHNQFQAALNEAKLIAMHKTDYKDFYNSLINIINGYLLWDIFAYDKAFSNFNMAMKSLKHYGVTIPEFKNMYNNMLNDMKILENVYNNYSVLRSTKLPISENIGKEYLTDIMSNIERCASHGHYDDAVARLYSLTEKIAKIGLAKLGINNSNIDQEVIAKTSEDFKNKFERELKPKENKSGKLVISLPLQPSFALLGELQPDLPIYKTFLEIKDDLDKSLQSRNNSLLAHGYKPISVEDYNKLKSLVLRLLEEMDIKEKDIPAFSKLEMDGLLC